MILEAKKLSFRYEESGRKILDQFSLQVDSSERVGILAPSGFGKTTLCKILSGYEEPEEGTVLLDGKSLYSYKDYCPVQMIWQHPEQAFDPRLRIGRSIQEVAGLDEDRLEGLLGAFGVRPDWLSRRPHELSGGELMRVAMVRALVSCPRYLVADESTAMLDAVTQADLWHVLMGLQEREGWGMALVSHSPDLLSRVATRTVRL